MPPIMGCMTALIQALLDPRCYPHPVSHVRLIETHISWLLLTGTYAYKIKKPVDLGFADFRTLDQRLHCCKEEIRLNRRFARDIYLRVVPITGSPSAPAVDGEGPALEYAVQMHEFDQSDLLLARLQDDRIEPAHIDALADACAAFHADAAVASAAGTFGAAAALFADATANFDAIEPFVEDTCLRTRVARLRQWTIDAHRRLTHRFERRRHDGHIRECHGDLHLRNIVLLQERITPFDCIEFNESFRWIDVMNELAFTAMDLAAQGRLDYSHRLVNRYLEASGDYDGLDVLPFYLVYRAMVRAKVDCLHAAQGDVTPDTRDRERADFVTRIALAEHHARSRRPFVAITCGLSGSGKTHLSELALERVGAIRIRSDVERRRLSAGRGTRFASGLNTGLYSPRSTDRTFERLATLGRIVVAGGYPLIVDATFIHRARRKAFADLAQQLGVPFVILHCQARLHVAEARIARRLAEGKDASEADAAVLHHQRATAEPFGNDEQGAVVTIDTEDPSSIESALTHLGRVGASS